MRTVTSCLAGAFALWGISAAPASAVQVRFDVEEISTLLAAGIFPLDVADFEGFLLFDLVDTNEDGMLDAGTLIDMRLKAFGPVIDDGSFGGSPGDALTLGLLPGQVEILQIRDGTEYQYPNPAFDPDTAPAEPMFLMATAVDPVGILEPSVETPGAKRFTFDEGELLAAEGAPETGVATCDGFACTAAINNIGELPLDLSGPQPPLEVGAVVAGEKVVFFEIVGLETIESTPASLTGSFSFFLGAFPVEFDILSATGVVVPEPGAGLGIAASLGTLAWLGRRRRAAGGLGRSGSHRVAENRPMANGDRRAGGAHPEP